MPKKWAPARSGIAGIGLNLNMHFHTLVSTMSSARLRWADSLTIWQSRPATPRWRTCSTARLPAHAPLRAPVVMSPARRPLPFDHAYGLWQDRRTMAGGRYPRCAKQGNTRR